MLSRTTPLYVLACTLLCTAVCPAEDWPQWRGVNRDGRSLDKGLLAEWPDDGPAVVWQVDSVGVGYSSIAVADGRIFTLGDLDGVEHVICLSEKDGSVIWAVQPKPLAEQLTKRVAEQFLRLDKDDSGKLDELEAVGLDRGAFAAESTSDGDLDEIAGQRASWLFGKLDADKSDKLAFDEVPRQLSRDLFTRADRPDEAADVEALAKSRVADAMKADEDGDGKVSQREARDSLLQLQFGRIDERLPNERRGDGFLTEDELHKYFTTRDRGRDGQITFDELRRYYRQTYPGRDGVFSKDDVRRAIGGYRNGMGDGPRGTPTVDDGLVYVEGGNGDVTCLDVVSGETVWHINLVRDLGGGRPGWGYCESPLVVNDWLIVTPGGNQGTIVALDKATGDVVWRSEDVKEGAHYSSAMFTEVAGVPQIVQFARNSVFGITLDGKLLWNYSGANNGTANVATPIIAGDHVLASSSYGVGGGLVKVTRDGNSQSAEEVYFEKKLANHHGGLVKVDDHVYGFGGNSLICIEFLTGDIAWQARSVTKGSLTYADGHLYCLGEKNQVALVEANPEKYVEKGRFTIPRSGRPSWAHPVVANGRFYIRDQASLTSYNVRAD